MTKSGCVYVYVRDALRFCFTRYTLSIDVLRPPRRPDPPEVCNKDSSLEDATASKHKKRRGKLWKKLKKVNWKKVAGKAGHIVNVAATHEGVAKAAGNSKHGQRALKAAKKAKELKDSLHGA